MHDACEGGAVLGSDEWRLDFSSEELNVGKRRQNQSQYTLATRYLQI